MATVRIRVVKPIRIDAFNARSPRGRCARRDKVLPPGEYTATRTTVPVTGFRAYIVHMPDGWTYGFPDWKDGYEEIG